MVSSSRSQKTRQTLFLFDACGQTFEKEFNMKEHTNTNHEFLVFMTQKFKKHLKLTKTEVIFVKSKGIKLGL